jgi:hypothetical protein
VDPIRPAPLQTTPTATPGADAARQAAQKAFFDAAMGRAAAPTATRATAPAPAPQRVELRPTANAEPPTRILRPGSLLDIRI